MSTPKLVVSNPSVSGPCLNFGTGVADQDTNCSIYFQNNPNISGSLNSDWALIQWGMMGPYNEPEYLNPATAKLPPEDVSDPFYGSALYSVTNSDGADSFSVFQSQDGSFVYDIEDSISPATAPTSVADPLQDIFLSTTPFPANQPPITMNYPLAVSFDERIKNTEVSGLDTTGSGNNNPITYALLGMVLTYNSATFHAVLFLQTGLTDSRYGNTAIAYQNTSYDGGTTTVIYDDSTQNNAALPFISSNTVENIQLNVNAMLDDALMTVPTLTASDSGTEELANWTFNGLYIGTETSGTDTFTGTGLTGSATLELQLSNIIIAQNTTTLCNYNPAPAEGSALISETSLGAPNSISELTAAQAISNTLDGMSDILVEDTGGDMVVWPVANGTLSGSPAYIGTATDGWSYLATGDFNGDGTTDILVGDTGGDMVDWTIKNGAISGTPTYVGTATDGWKFLATGDFYGNGTDDILVTDTAGDMVTWPITDGTLSGSPTYVGTVTDGWKFLTTGDFNGDGTTDILVTDTLGDLVDWTIRDGTLSGTPTYIGTVTDGWKFLAAGDFYGNGTDDILVTDAGGDIVDWTLRNGTLSGSPAYIGTATGGWSFLGTGNFNGNATADILLSNVSGAIVEWTINNGALSGPPTYIGTATDGWHVVPPA